MAEGRLFIIDGELDHHIPDKRPGVAIGKLVDDMSVKAIVVDDITAAEQHEPRNLEGEAAAECLSEAQKLAALVGGTPGSETNRIVLIKSAAGGNLVYTCTSLIEHQRVTIFWDKQAKPPEAALDLIASAGEFVTGASQAEVRQEINACLSQALKRNSNGAEREFHEAEREFHGVKIECGASTGNGASGSVMVTELTIEHRRRLRGRSVPTVPLTASAAEKTVDLDRLVSEPMQFIKKDIRLSKIPCVYDPKDDFVCVREVNGQVLRIDAGSLGSATSKTIADKLTTSCKGTANLQRKDCEFSIAISFGDYIKKMMDTEEGSLPITILLSKHIDLFQKNSANGR